MNVNRKRSEEDGGGEEKKAKLGLALKRWQKLLELRNSSLDYYSTQKREKLRSKE